MNSDSEVYQCDSVFTFRSYFQLFVSIFIARKKRSDKGFASPVPLRSGSLLSGIGWRYMRLLQKKAPEYGAFF
jgi:hypothetical protein